MAERSRRAWPLSAFSALAVLGAGAAFPISLAPAFATADTGPVPHGQYVAGSIYTTLPGFHVIIEMGRSANVLYLYAVTCATMRKQWENTYRGRLVPVALRRDRFSFDKRVSVTETIVSPTYKVTHPKLGIRVSGQFTGGKFVGTASMGSTPCSRTARYTAVRHGENHL